MIVTIAIQLGPDKTTKKEVGIVTHLLYSFLTSVP
jgi:hypothetical protein